MREKLKKWAGAVRFEGDLVAAVAFCRLRLNSSALNRRQ